MEVSILNGAGQSDYLYGLVSGLATTPVNKIKILDIDLAAPFFERIEKVNFQSVYRYQKKGTSRVKKAANILNYYFQQSRHLLTIQPRIIHFQWLDRYFFTDRILLPVLARLRGHKVILTVHNVNAGRRDKRDSFYNRFTLHMLYNLCNHLIVHTEKSKQELMDEFNVNPNKISIIKHGMNNMVSTKGISQETARNILKIGREQKVVLFFGNIDFYKGLDILIESLNYLSPSLKSEVTLLIAGNSKSKDYLKHIHEQLDNSFLKERAIVHIMFIQDEDIETYFMAADCIVLPYREIYQSGVLFLAYNFGLPAVATRIGNFENDILPGKTGLLIENVEVKSMAETIEMYFNSPLFKDLINTRKQIREWSYRQFSWESIGEETFNLYQNQLNK